jgi:hypothetical protein
MICRFALLVMFDLCQCTKWTAQNVRLPAFVTSVCTRYLHTNDRAHRTIHSSADIILAGAEKFMHDRAQAFLRPRSLAPRLKSALILVICVDLVGQ